ncbi:MAG: hypothetical protein QXH91_04635 [Candidatus Bathyarchaeia archaeon]
MPQESEEGSFATFMAKVAGENEVFLKNNAKEVLKEVVELVNDAIDYLPSVVNREKADEYYLKYSAMFFFVHILMPASYGVYANLILGNLPVCFIELRLILESLAKCYVADLCPERELFFETKLMTLEEIMREKEISTSDLLKDFGEITGLPDKPLKLWGKLSEGWVHTRGIVQKIINHIEEKSDLPPYALPIPMNYTDNDVDSLNELAKRTSELRKILKAACDKYKMEVFKE